MNGKPNRHGLLGMALALVAGLILGGVTYGAVVASGASGTSTTYYACLTTTRTLTKVGTVSPAKCKAGGQIISWNSVGPLGPGSSPHLPPSLRARMRMCRSPLGRAATSPPGI